MAEGERQRAGRRTSSAGFVIDNGALIIGGALVGASGGILTLLMARAMNRSVLGVMMGGFGTGDSGPVGGPAAGAGASVGASRPRTPPSSWPTPARSSSSPATAWPPRRPITRRPSWPRCCGSTPRCSSPSTRSQAGARLHERAARRGERVLGGPEGDGRGQPRVPDRGRGAGRRGQRCHEPGGPPARQPCVRHADPERGPGQERHRDQAVHGPRLRRDRQRAVHRPETGMFFSDAKGGLAEIIAAVKALVPS
jgi:hypothetical protein